jgi:hypothetical protein
VLVGEFGLDAVQFAGDVGAVLSRLTGELRFSQEQACVDDQLVSGQCAAVVVKEFGILADQRPGDVGAVEPHVTDELSLRDRNMLPSTANRSALNTPPLAVRMVSRQSSWPPMCAPGRTTPPSQRNPLERPSV